jgi:hypothetical protein
MAIEARGQRTVTLFAYLNDVPVGAGGETGFNLIRDLKV